MELKENRAAEERKSQLSLKKDHRRGEEVRERRREREKERERGRVSETECEQERQTQRRGHERESL